MEAPQIMSTADRDITASPVSVEIVIPIFNEAEVIPALLAELDSVFSFPARENNHIDKVVYCFVDDGSRDASVQVIYSIGSRVADIRLIRLSRNFGHQAAVSAGLAHSDADMVAVIDADLQDPPALILEMIRLVRDGYHVVYAQRRRRSEGVIKQFCYWLFYRLYNLLSPLNLPLDSGDFCLMSRRVVEEINNLPERLRFARGLRTWVGFQQIGISYDRPARAAGSSKYSWRRLYELATDGIASQSVFPLRFSQFVAVIFLLVGLTLALITGVRLFTGQTNYSLELAMLTVVLLSNSLILFCLYVMGAYIGRTYLEVKGRPNHIVREVKTIDRAVSANEAR